MTLTPFVEVFQKEHMQLLMGQFFQVGLIAIRGISGEEMATDIQRALVPRAIEVSTRQTFEERDSNVTEQLQKVCEYVKTSSNIDDMCGR